MQRRLLTLSGITLTVALVYFGSLFYLDSRIPRATTIVQVHPGQNVSFISSTSSYMENEFEKITSRETLALAANELAVDSNHHRSAILSLKKAITAEPIRGSDFIKITAKDEDPRRAADIANAVANAYAKVRSLDQQKKITKALTAMEAKIISQDKRVQSHFNELQIFVQENDLSSTKKATPFPKSYNIGKYHSLMKTYKDSKSVLRDIQTSKREALTLLQTPSTPITIHQRAE